jgi:hypothetical protein
MRWPKLEIRDDFVVFLMEQLQVDSDELFGLYAMEAHLSQTKREELRRYLAEIGVTIE